MSRIGLLVMYLEPDTLVGRYRIQRRLGRGGMGTLYLALDPVLGRQVAVKVFHGDLELADLRDRFAREARAVAALNHPNVVTIYDYGELSTQPYIVMEYMEGRTLTEIIHVSADVGIPQKLRWMEELCAGVGFVHRAGIIHRDIKPSNVMVDTAGRLKVLDFGIARMGTTFAASATGPIGSPGYMAPEQIRGTAIDHRADIFAIGVVSYELLTSTPAFQGETFERVHKILNLEPTSLLELSPGLPTELSEIVGRALAKDPTARFSDAESMAAAFARVRHRFESAQGRGPQSEPDILPTVIVVRPQRVLVPTPDPGSGPGSPAVADGGAAVTPRPGMPWTDREAFGRRRTQQIDAALQEARGFLDQGRFEEASDACERALTIDETHRDALALYAEVRKALARREAAAIVAEARLELARGAVSAAAELLQRARALDPAVPEAARLERAVRLARVDADRARNRGEALTHALQSARDALDRGELEPALVYAREALDLDAGNQDARDIEAAALGRLDEETGAGAAAQVDRGDDTPQAAVVDALAGLDRSLDSTPVDERGQGVVNGAAATESRRSPAPSSPTPRQWPALDLATPLKPLVAGAQAGIRRLVTASQARWVHLGRKQRQALAFGAVLLSAGVVATGVWSLQRAAPLRVSIVVIDAAPWARVDSIVAEGGREIDLSATAATPLSMSLPVGLYTVVLIGPPPALERRQFDVRVEEGHVTVAPVQPFSPLTPEDYFEPYITSGGDGVR